VLRQRPALSSKQQPHASENAFAVQKLDRKLLKATAEIDASQQR
jgi:hypothetical protein